MVSHLFKSDVIELRNCEESVSDSLEQIFLVLVPSYLYFILYSYILHTYIFGTFLYSSCLNLISHGPLAAPLYKFFKPKRKYNNMDCEFYLTGILPYFIWRVLFWGKHFIATIELPM